MAIAGSVQNKCGLVVVVGWETKTSGRPRRVMNLENELGEKNKTKKPLDWPQLAIELDKKDGQRACWVLCRYPSRPDRSFFLTAVPFRVSSTLRFVDRWLCVMTLWSDSNNSQNMGWSFHIQGDFDFFLPPYTTDKCVLLSYNIRSSLPVGTCYWKKKRKQICYESPFLCPKMVKAKSC